MMERDFYNDEFEELLREKTDHYKMYPSDKAWKNIYQSLHGRKRRYYVFGMSLLVGGFLIFAGNELIAPGRTITPPATASNPSVSASGQEAIDLSIFRLQDLQKSTKKNTIAKTHLTNENVWKHPESILDQNTTELIAANDQLAAAPAEEPLDPATNNTVYREFRQTDYTPAMASLSHIAVQPVHTATLTAPVVSGHPANQLDLNDQVKEVTVGQLSANDRSEMTWLQDKAIVHLNLPRQHRLYWQFYFSPTVNYRKLSGGNYADSRSTVQNVPIALVHYGTANDFVDHTPAMGYEVGGSLLYRLTRSLSVRAGLQFNYSRYFIKAYSSAPELATITLNSYYGYFADSITGYTNVRNFSGKSSEYLQNRYFQLSLPVGIELRVVGNGKLQFHVAGTVQPTYLINRNSYLLTTDYSNYTKEPSLFRQWNVNAGAEAFISYQTGSLRWQIGPQFRYQLFSTYTDNYPLRENLMEYGIKLGVSKSIR